mmetsp:Transcript_101631/g.322807  ORF Transcript_101631/g.322807 Transcript_101631/m.322807 type:complete len:509 (-) Transcript_101631:541-2067(-)
MGDSHRAGARLRAAGARAERGRVRRDLGGEGRRLVAGQCRRRGPQRSAARCGAARRCGVGGPGGGGCRGAGALPGAGPRDALPGAGPCGGAALPGPGSRGAAGAVAGGGGGRSARIPREGPPRGCGSAAAAVVHRGGGLQPGPGAVVGARTRPEEVGLDLRRRGLAHALAHAVPGAPRPAEPQQHATRRPEPPPGRRGDEPGQGRGAPGGALVAVHAAARAPGHHVAGHRPERAGGVGRHVRAGHGPHAAAAGRHHLDRRQDVESLRSGPGGVDARGRLPRPGCGLPAADARGARANSHSHGRSHGPGRRRRQRSRAGAPRPRRVDGRLGRRAGLPRRGRREGAGRVDRVPAEGVQEPRQVLPRPRQEGAHRPDERLPPVQGGGGAHAAVPLRPGRRGLPDSGGRGGLLAGGGPALDLRRRAPSGVVADDRVLLGRGIGHPGRCEHGDQFAPAGPVRLRADRGRGGGAGARGARCGRERSWRTSGQRTSSLRRVVCGLGRPLDTRVDI